MILADKIIYLRKKNGWSQEELAEKLDVTRQSVSKWESAGSIPDINKIIEMGKIFGVTTDFLLKDNIEIEEFSNEPDAGKNIVSLEEAEKFMASMVKYGKETAIGVVLCILSPVVLLYMAGLSEAGKVNEDVVGGIGVIVLLMMIAIAVVIFIYSSAKMKQYKYIEKGDFELAYGVSGIVNEKIKAAEARFALLTGVGTALCILCSVPIIAGAVLGVADCYLIFAVDLLLIMIAVAVYIFTTVEMVKSSFNQLLKQEEYEPERREIREKLDRIAGFYWCVVTAIYLAISLPTNNIWHISWVIWPVAALIYAGIAALFERE